MERDKTEIKKEAEEKYLNLMLHEKDKFDTKLKYLNTLNETLNNRVDDFAKLEPGMRETI